jgi:hypothetical protein
VEDLTTGKLRWGMLTNGARWRLYYQGARSVSEQFFDGPKIQSERFIEAARKLGCDEDPAHFDEILKKVVRHKSPSDAPCEPKGTEDEETRVSRVLGRQFSLSINGALPALQHPILL